MTANSTHITSTKVFIFSYGITAQITIVDLTFTVNKEVNKVWNKNEGQNDHPCRYNACDKSFNENSNRKRAREYDDRSSGSLV